MITYIAIPLFVFTLALTTKSLITDVRHIGRIARAKAKPSINVHLQFLPEWNNKGKTNHG